VSRWESDVTGDGA